MILVTPVLTGAAGATDSKEAHIPGNGRIRTALGGILAVVIFLAVNFWPSEASATEAPCYTWHNQIPLQTAVDTYACVAVAAGGWTVPWRVKVPAGHTLTGQSKETTTIRAASSGWKTNGNEGVVGGTSTGAPIKVSSLTLDAGNIASYAAVTSGGLWVDAMKGRGLRSP